jgi:hypothetical protein
MTVNGMYKRYVIREDKYVGKGGERGTWVGKWQSCGEGESGNVKRTAALASGASLICMSVAACDAPFTRGASVAAASAPAGPGASSTDLMFGVCVCVCAVAVIRSCRSDIICYVYAVRHLHITQDTREAVESLKVKEQHQGNEGRLEQAPSGG